MKKNSLLVFPLFIWALLIIFEWASLFFQYPKPMYFRAWEYMLNEGKDGYYVPFKPNAEYHGTLYGDQFHVLNFIPRPSELYWQDFQADEYGFRNRKGLLKKPVDAVLFGTSFVGGAHATQKDIVNEILLRKYNIRAYNYATLPLQHFWEDQRFIKNVPRYAIIIGNESEIFQNSWIEVLQETKITRQIRSWPTYESWEKINYPFMYDYSSISKYVKRFSIIRFLSQEVFTRLINSLLPRKYIAYQSVQVGSYDPMQDMTFLDVNSFDPTYNTTTKKAEQDTYATLIKTRDILRKRNIHLIVAIMPSKSHLYAKKYSHLPIEKTNIFKLQEDLKKKNISFIDLQSLIEKNKTLSKMPLYFNQDGHWTQTVNYLVAGEISKIIH